MAVGQYFGVGGVARKSKDQNFGVAGVARKVKNGYIGIGGVARKYYTGLDIKATLADNDWATIAAVSAAGLASTYWSVGGTKDITLSTGETLTLAIMGFNHDDLTSGGKAGITFGLKDLMAEKRRMNDTNTNSGGFTGSAMYTWLQNTLLGQLPSDLQSGIKTVNKKTSKGNKNSTINTDAMKLFLFAEIEVFGTTSYSFAGEGSRYSYFSVSNRRQKGLANGTGDIASWYGRSPRNSVSTAFFNVDQDGRSGGINASTNSGVCFGFCV